MKIDGLTVLNVDGTLLAYRRDSVEKNLRIICRLAKGSVAADPRESQPTAHALF